MTLKPCSETNTRLFLGKVRRLRPSKRLTSTVRSPARPRKHQAAHLFREAPMGGGPPEPELKSQLGHSIFFNFFLPFSSYLFIIIIIISYYCFSSLLLLFFFYLFIFIFIPVRFWTNNCAANSTTIRSGTVYHSYCISWTHSLMIKPSSDFRKIPLSCSLMCELITNL